MAAKLNTFIFIGLFAISVMATAQGRNGSARARNAAGKSASSDNQLIIYLPDFFHRDPLIVGDTTYRWSCYDVMDRPVNPDTLTNAQTVQEIRVTKGYYYGQALSAVISRPYLTAKLAEYNRTSRSAWTMKDKITNTEKEVQVSGDQILRADTSIISGEGSGARTMIIRRYFKTNEDLAPVFTLRK